MAPRSFGSTSPRMAAILEQLPIHNERGGAGGRRLRRQISREDGLPLPRWRRSSSPGEELQSITRGSRLHRSHRRRVWRLSSRPAELD
ncbi:hypothetical protein FKM82_010416 [Ascaphus truei]